MTREEFIAAQKARKKIKSNRKFAEAAGVSPGVIDDWENGIKRNTDVPTLQKLADFSGLSIVTLFNIAYPDAPLLDLNVEDRVYLEMMRELPPEVSEVVKGYITNLYTQNKRK